MATGKTTAHAGVQRLDSLDGGDSLLAKTYVYVPERSVGPRRSPLLVLMHGGDGAGVDMVKIFQPFADSAGIILLAPTSASEDRGWGSTRSVDNVDLPRLDAALRTVLRHYAIDPARLALYGTSAGSGAALNWGYVNGDIFSLAIIDSDFGPFDGDRQFAKIQGHGRSKFYVVMTEKEFPDAERMAALLRHSGRAVTLVKDNYGHGSNPERAVGQFAWLVENWR